MCKRPGYYVEQRYFRDAYHQAVARANHLATEYGRSIDVKFVSHEEMGRPSTSIPSTIFTAHPQENDNS